MAPRATAAAESGGQISNSFDPAKTPEFVSRIQSVQAEIDEIMQKAKDACAPLREDMEEIKTEAHESGLPRLELNALVRKEKLEARAAGVRTKLSEEQQANFDRMDLAMVAFRDTPLGASANKPN